MPDPLASTDGAQEGSGTREHSLAGELRRERDHPGRLGRAALFQRAAQLLGVERLPKLGQRLVVQCLLERRRCSAGAGAQRLRRAGENGCGSRLTSTEGHCCHEIQAVRDPVVLSELGVRGQTPGHGGEGSLVVLQPQEPERDVLRRTGPLVTHPEPVEASRSLAARLDCAAEVTLHEQEVAEVVHRAGERQPCLRSGGVLGRPLQELGRLGVVAADCGRIRQAAQRAGDLGVVPERGDHAEPLARERVTFLEVSLRHRKRPAPEQGAPERRRRFGRARAQRLADPAASLADVAADEPEAPQRARDAEQQVRCSSVASPREPGVEVRDVVFQASEPECLLGAAELLVCLLGDVGEVLGVPSLCGVGLPVGTQPLECVLADRVEHREARLAVNAAARDDQALVAQRRQEAESGLVVTEHSSRGSERDPAGEDRELLQRRLLDRLEQRVAPVDRRNERLLPSRHVSRAAGEEREPLLQTARDLGQREQPDAGGRELDRERQAVQPPADRAHLLHLRRCRLGHRARSSCAREEQLEAVVVDERWHRVLGLGRHVQALAARRQNPKSRAFRHEVAHERGGGDQPLEVVEHEQQLAVAEAAHERVRGGLARLLGEAKRPGDDGRHRVRIVDAREPDEEGAVGVRRGDRARDLDRESGLADPARPRQRQQRRPRERVEDLLCLVATADERGARQREVPETLGLQRREVEAEARRDELEQPLGPRDALEEVVAEIAHLEAVADEVTRRLREYDLSTVRGRADTCTAREVDADVVPAGRQLRLARVDAHPHPDRLPLGPVVRREGELARRGAVERVTRTLEGEEERVALCVDLDAAVHGERRAQQLPVGGQGVVVADAEESREPRRPLDVREEERDGSLRKFRHVVPAGSAVGVYLAGLIEVVYLVRLEVQDDADLLCRGFPLEAHLRPSAARMEHDVPGIDLTVAGFDDSRDAPHELLSRQVSAHAVPQLRTRLCRDANP